VTDPDYREWRGHIIVCGLEEIGLRTVEQLHRIGIEVIVVDDAPDPRLMEITARWHVPVIIADPRLEESLEMAGLAGARAVVCAERTDLAALETALLVREIDAEKRLVVQLANPGVGRALVAVTGTGSVLDMAELTAPSLIEACLMRTTHAIDIAGLHFVAAEVVAEEDATLRRLFGDLAPVAIVPGSGGVVVCPGRDHQVTSGDRVTMLGTADDLGWLGTNVTRESAQRIDPRLTVAIKRTRVFLASIAAESDRALRAALTALVLLVVSSSVILEFTYRLADGRHLGLLNAAYFTVETVATVGYGDFYFAGQSPWLVAFGIALIVLGVGLLTTAFALFTNLLVARRIAQSFGRHRVPGIRDHIVVVGFGSVGLAVVEGLIAARVPVVVVEKDDKNRYLDRARALGVPVVIGDATQRQTLESVNVPSCRAVALLTSDDLSNIEAGLAARDALEERWAEVPVVVRLFDRKLARTVERGFGFHYVRSTSELAAPWFVGAALGLSIIATFSVERQPFLVASLQISSDGGLVGLAMAELSARIRVVALQRGGPGGSLEHPPRRGTRFAPGDVAFLLGPYEEILTVLLHDERGGNPPETVPTP
jgi:Trk K+ transport system NAD-binding subunit